MSALVEWVQSAQVALFGTQVHSVYVPFSVLDTLGALRLAVFLEQFIRQRNGIDAHAYGAEKRGGYLSECLGIFLLIFGGETLLGACLNFTPSWLQSPLGLLLFCGMHLLVSRTPLNRLVPRKSSLAVELPLSLFDALGRAFALTSFSADLILSHPSFEVRNNAWLLAISSWITTVPFLSLAFACDMFARDWSLNTPGEVKPWGWLAVDFWSPLVITPLYVALTQAHPTFVKLYAVLRSYALPTIASFTDKPLAVAPPVWTKSEARAACAIVLAVLFAGRAIYNFGSLDDVFDRRSLKVKARRRVANGGTATAKPQTSPAASGLKKRSKVP